jgi:hypothetical protein
MVALPVAVQRFLQPVDLLAVEAREVAVSESVRVVPVRLVFVERRADLAAFGAADVAREVAADAAY